MTLIVVRHGESEGNARRVIQGQLDTALTPLGEAQAAAVAERFAGASIAAVYGTPLRRAYDTAHAIAEPHGLEATRDPDLAERGFGEAQGLDWDQVRERWPADTGADWNGIPGVEPLPAFRERAVGRMEALLDRHDGELAIVVSHGGTIAQLVAHTLGMGLEAGDWPRIRVGNTSVTVFERERGAPVLAMLNDLCHLRAAEATAPPPV